MKCTISSVFLLVSVFNWGWIEDFKHNASIYNLKKTTSLKNAQTFHHMEDSKIENCPSCTCFMWTSGLLLTSVTFLVHFLILFLMFIWICLKLSFQQGVKTIFEKIDYMPIFCVGLWCPGGMWHKKRSIFICNGHFWEMHKENEAFL